MNKIIDNPEEEPELFFQNGSPHVNPIDRAGVLTAVQNLLSAIGEDPTRAGLSNTPDRVARMYEELLEGYWIDPESDCQ